MKAPEASKTWHFEAGFVHLRDVIEAAEKHGPQRIVDGGREFSLALVRSASPAAERKKPASGGLLEDDGLDALLAPRRAIGAAS